LILGAFLGGRYATPDKIKTITQTVTIKDTSIKNKEVKTDTNIVYKYIDRPVDRVITKTIIKEPNGKVTETNTDSTHQGNTEINQVKDVQTKVEVQVKKEIVYQDRVVEKIVVNNKNKLDFGASLGYSVFSSDATNLIPRLPDRMVVGGYATYKIGDLFKMPIKAGASVNTRGDLSLIVGASF
jgi:hypothetical protein